MPNPNPFEEYGLLDFWRDSKPKQWFSDDFSDHAGFYESLPALIRNERPYLYEEFGGRKDRNVLDQMMNIMGGYDYAARSGDPQLAREGSRAYQYTDYARRPEDAIGDYYESLIGIDAYDPEQGRMDIQGLLDFAEGMARQRAHYGEGSEYEIMNEPDMQDKIANTLGTILKGRR
jgi:hypothetical protein